MKDVEGQVGSMKSAVERISTDVSGSSTVLSLIMRYSVGHDGKTPYERLQGTTSTVFGFELGEGMLFRRVPVSSKLALLDSLWNVGIFVGYGSTNGEYTPEGARKTGTLRRQPEEKRGRREDVESMKFTPWATRGDSTLQESCQEEKVNMDYDLGQDFFPQGARAL